MATEYRFLGVGSSGTTGIRRAGEPRLAQEPEIRIAVGKRGTLVTLPLTRDEALHAAVRLIETVQRAYRDTPPITESEES